MTTAAMEWARLDKSSWGDGPWQNEPDKVQWLDEATGLDCLIVRNNGGALCGYVGVPESHPWHGKDYSQCTQTPACDESYCDHTPEHRLRVHGGITFADGCNEPSRERWERWREAMVSRKGEAAKYPQGDAAREWRDLSHLMGNYNAWREYMTGRTICHIPLAGRPDKVWWFGFDCAHSGDLLPAYKDLGGLGIDRYETYKDRRYVEGEVRQLAEQLAGVGVAPTGRGSTPEEKA